MNKLYELFTEVTRGDTVESRHFGAAVVCDYKGNILHQWGDIDQLVFPRSALKPIQAIGLVESGASNQYELSDAEIALACASHLGEDIHVDVVREWLDRLGLNQDHLACGSQLPSHTESAHKLLAQDQSPCRIHHNCSGKHAGFLTTAQFLKLPVENYHQLDHPVQKLSFEIIADLTQLDPHNHPIGVDGCGFPAITLPLKSLGTAMARFANPVDLSDDRAKAIKRIHKALAQAPLYIAGHGSTASELIEVTQGTVLAKNGAEGVFVAALPEQGLGVALKISDGNPRGRSVALLAILDQLGVLSDSHKQQLKEHIKPDVLNSRNEKVGEIRPAAPLMSKK